MKKLHFDVVGTRAILIDEDWWCYEKRTLKIKYRKLENMQIGQKKTTGHRSNQVVHGIHIRRKPRLKSDLTVSTTDLCKGTRPKLRHQVKSNSRARRK